MKRSLGGPRFGALAVLVLVLTASCGGAESTPEAIGSEEGSSQQSSAETLALPAPQAPAPETALTVAPGEEPLETPGGECGGEATMIETNTPLEITMFGTKQYVCVMVPEGMTLVAFEISDMSVALDLFVGYPDLATLEAGGPYFWASERGGRDDELITIDLGATGFVDPGPYFVEISGGASADGGSFVLTVSMS